MRLLLVRHGQMDFSDDGGALHADEVNPWFNAEREAGLSELGRHQARAVSRILLKHPVDAVYSSGLLRARQTAEVTAARLGLRVQRTDDLAELRPGSLPDDGLAYGGLRLLGRLPVGPERQRRLVGSALIPLYFTAWITGRTDGGETRAEFEARLGRVFARLRQDHPPDARVALFAHGYVIFYTAGWLCRPGPVRWRVIRRSHVANGAITELELGACGPPTLLRYADTRHL